jgi:hypothetical protein
VPVTQVRDKPRKALRHRGLRAHRVSHDRNRLLPPPARAAGSEIELPALSLERAV